VHFIADEAVGLGEQAAGGDQGKGKEQPCASHQDVEGSAFHEDFP
jgi:hypothetical protein